MLIPVVLFFYLNNIGFFDTTFGQVTLFIAALLCTGILYFLVIDSDSNPKALKGTDGYIVGDVKRFDERETVFARNRSLRPGSEQYK